MIVARYIPGEEGTTMAYRWPADLLQADVAHCRGRCPQRQSDLFPPGGRTLQKFSSLCPECVAPAEFSVSLREISGALSESAAVPFRLRHKVRANARKLRARGP